MSDERLRWGKLLSEYRIPKAAAQVEGPADAAPEWLVQSRTETERDFDRILFATPTRRLGDKTQVFPLEKNESVRNRLTHSHEVANLARSIGIHLVHSDLGQTIVDDAVSSADGWSAAKVRRAIPALLAAVGLAHDLGNPPFGHQGEIAIRNWILAEDRFSLSDGERNRIGLAELDGIELDFELLTSRHRQDFRRFEGNAQTLRTLTRLQVVKDHRGLNLTFGTLAALMKYTVPSDHPNVGREGVTPSTRKVGFFSSEADLVREVRERTGLGAGHRRHPLTHVMEACDDIAYVVVDAEDAVKKQIVSFHDMIAWLEHRRCEKSGKPLAEDELTAFVLREAKKGAEQARAARVPPSELNDVAMQIFRAHAISAMVSAVITAFRINYEAIMTTGLAASLVELSIAHEFAEALREFDKLHAYRHRRVLEVELSGFNTIQSLLDMLWRGITEREDIARPDSARTTPFARYAYGRISENYRRVFEGRLPVEGGRVELPIRYRELQLLTDMVAGMTDQYALDLHRELQSFHVGASKLRQ